MKKRKIILASLIGVIAISTVSVTLAWYANSNILHVEEFVITIDGDRELLVSTQEEDLDLFKDSLSTEELNHVPVFIPVSSMFSSSWLDEKESHPSFYDSSMHNVIEGVPYYGHAETFGFLSQDLYLLADDDVYVTIDALKTSLTANALFNIAYAQELATREEYKHLSVDEIYERLNNLVNAMRFSILVPDEECYQYIVIDPNYNEEIVYFGGVLDNTITGYYDWYFHNNQLNDKREIVYGDITDRDLAVYDEALDEDSDYVLDGDASAFNAKHEKGVKRLNFEKSLENGMGVARENRTSLEELDNDESIFYFPVYEYQPRKIVLSIYIEGWDLDSINSTMGAYFLANLSFKIYREM